MHIKVKDSSVPKRVITGTVSHDDDNVFLILDDVHVEAIGVCVYMTHDEAYKLIGDLLFHTTVEASK